jgi:hypothetical protein
MGSVQNRAWQSRGITHLFAMGAIKDIVALAKDLESRAKDPRDVEAIHKIQALAFSLQSQLADTLERDVSLMEENAQLKKQLTDSQVEEIRIYRGIEFRRGKRTHGKWMPFCPKCHMPSQYSSAVSPSGFPSPAIVCSAHCGWHVFEGLKIADILMEMPA